MLTDSMSVYLQMCFSTENDAGIDRFVFLHNQINH